MDSICRFVGHPIHTNKSFHMAVMTELLNYFLVFAFSLQKTVQHK